MAKAMQGMAAAMGGGGDGKPVEPVAFQTLQSARCRRCRAGTMGEPRGERMTLPIAVLAGRNRVPATATPSIDVKIVDTGFAQMLIAPWSMFLASGYSRETSDGYEKATTVGGHPGFEKWDKDAQARRAERPRRQALPRHDRRPTTSPTPRSLHEFASKMDFGKIAALK